MGRNVTARIPQVRCARAILDSQACSCPPARDDRVVAGHICHSNATLSTKVARSHRQVLSHHRSFGKFRLGAAYRTQSTGPLKMATEVKMPHIYFHCSTPRGLIVDRCGSQVEDIIEACDRAEQIVHTLIAGSSPEDWRTWILHVTDDEGEVFAVPFSSVLGRGLQ